MAQRNDGKELEGKSNTAKENFNKNPKRKRVWRVGDFCRAKYPADGMWYEVKVVSVEGSTCTVEFLGFSEKAQVELNSLDKTHRKFRMKNGKKHYYLSDDSDESISEDDSNDDGCKPGNRNAKGEIRHSASRYPEVKDFERGNGTGKGNYKKNSKKMPEWRVGDHCRAKYHEDNRWYEVKIVSIDGDMCIVDYLGYDDEVEVELKSLDKSHGKEAIKRQKQYAKRNSVDSDDESTSEDDSSSDRSVAHSRRHRRHSGRGNHSFDHPNNFSASGSTFHNAYPVPRYPMMPATMPPVAMPPVTFPPVAASFLEVPKDPLLYNSLYYMYVAGYYTGLYKAQRSASQECCHCLRRNNH